ncbi:Uncharacterised protein [Mycobacterium tuberculosis]|nr:Uncharacterised protein [Mycobacterium tuberculosis]
MSAKLIVEDIAPIFFDNSPNAPANKKIKIMIRMFSSPEPFAKLANFSLKFFLGNWKKATNRAITNTTKTGSA